MSSLLCSYWCQFSCGFGESRGKGSYRAVLESCPLRFSILSVVFCFFQWLLSSKYFLRKLKQTLLSGCGTLWHFKYSVQSVTFCSDKVVLLHLWKFTKWRSTVPSQLQSGAFSLCWLECLEKSKVAQIPLKNSQKNICWDEGGVFS